MRAAGESADAPVRSDKKISKCAVFWRRETAADGHGLRRKEKQIGRLTTVRFRVKWEECKMECISGRLAEYNRIFKENDRLCRAAARALGISEGAF